MNQIYLDTARLLTQVAPIVFADDVFALKGGTAINLFVRDMPRLSVDLDLVFLDHRVPRDEALAQISDALRQATGIKFDDLMNSVPLEPWQQLLDQAPMCSCAIDAFHPKAASSHRIHVDTARDVAISQAG